MSAIVNPRAVGFTVTADIFIKVEPGHVLDVARMIAEFEVRELPRLLDRGPGHQDPGFRP